MKSRRVTLQRIGMPTGDTASGHPSDAQRDREEKVMTTAAPHTPAATDAPPGVLRRAIAASAIGNATEWFDYGIYAYGITYLSAALFPGTTEQATLFALATFSISFLVRPLGGLFWGPLGDRLRPQPVPALPIL